jgi:hypothetical protein
MERLSHEPIITPAHKKVYLLTLIRTAKDKNGLVLCEDQMLWKIVWKNPKIPNPTFRCQNLKNYIFSCRK